MAGHLHSGRWSRGRGALPVPGRNHCCKAPTARFFCCSDCSAGRFGCTDCPPEATRCCTWWPLSPSPSSFLFVPSHIMVPLCHAYTVSVSCLCVPHTTSHGSHRGFVPQLHFGDHLITAASLVLLHDPLLCCGSECVGGPCCDALHCTCSLSLSHTTCISSMYSFPTSCVGASHPSLCRAKQKKDHSKEPSLTWASGVDSLCLK